MDNVTLIGIAVALAMDAFAVAASVAVSLPQWTARHTFRLSWHFGIFQAGMFLIGGFSGKAVSVSMDQVDHWIAFGVLMFLGLRMIVESFQPKDELSHYDPTRGVSLVGLSLATSIDALAVGVTLSLVTYHIYTAVILIGIITFVLSYVGYEIGKKMGHFFENKIEILGGLILIAIGLKILISHFIAN